MTHLQQKNRRISLFIFTSLLAIVALHITSCSKKEANANAKFIGIYQGNDCSGNALPNVVVTAGPNNSSIDIPFTIGIGACAKSITLTGNVSGNNVVFSSQNSDDLCGYVATVSGTASLNGSTFTINLISIESISGTDTTTYCFTGTK